MKPKQAHGTPVGFLLAQTAKTTARAFDDALQERGGSLPMWLILKALMAGEHRTQAELAATVGVQGPTLTHHLNGMEKDGLLMRSPLPDNRRVHQVALTDAGRALFFKLRDAAIAYDARLRAGIDVADLERFRAVLQRMSANVESAAGADEDNAAG
ncbi:MarR family winged helix-turn-helix transcriptional regulator [Ralstonia sp. 1138]|uniref:MarR family winged helix-turn-helix transcriptional regulator n=1 Tax=Ralstonia sp. 1138 TaxID=3156423 RepID=UPI00339256C8